LIILGLVIRAWPIVSKIHFSDLIFSSNWHPASGQFGLASFIVGTIVVTLIAMLLAVPVSLLTAIYLAEFSSRKIKELILPTVDLLAGISPVIFGVWGVLVIVPVVRDYLMPFFSSCFPIFPFISDNYTGYSVLAAGMVLAVMIIPIIVSIVVEVLLTVPVEIREATLSLGATRWETVKLAVVRKALPGIIAAIILGLSRAFGETMAVLMVAGCSLQGFPRSIFDAAYPLPALIANTYGEMMSIPLYDAAILFCALILLVVTMLFNMIGWGILLKTIRSSN
jgi:phosphate transport system permease protein